MIAQTKFVRRAIRELEAKAHAKGLSIYKMCKIAKVDMSTYYRWKTALTSPSLITWGKLHDAVDSYEP